MTKIKFIFSVFGDLLNPSEFSRITGISPTASWRKGDFINNRKPGLLRKENCWEFSLGFAKSLFIEDITNRFSQIFSGKMDQVVKYTKQNKLKTKMDLIVEIENKETPSIYFSADFIKLVSRLEGEIDIDIYIM